MPDNVTDPNINRGEHIEENIQAKRMAGYGWYPASTEWVRMQVDGSGVLQTSAQLVASSLSVQSTSTVWQGGAPWLVNSSLQGVPDVHIASAATLSIGAMPAVTANVAITSSTVFQGGAPWLVNASVIGTVPVSGFPAVQQVTGSVQATQSGAWSVGASISNIISVLATVSPLGVYNSIAPSLVSLQSQQLQLDQHANLLTNLATVGAPIPVNASIQGTIPVSGFPAVQQVSGSVQSSQQGAWNVTATIGNVVNALASIQGIPSVFVASGATISIAAMPPVSVAQTVQTVMQGGAPWLVNASVIGTIPVSGFPANQAVTASVIGVPSVLASIQGVPNVLATVSPLGIFNSIAPSLVSLQTQFLQIDQHANLLVNVATTGSPLQVTATVGTPSVNQGTSPWLVNASVVGQQAVTASVVGQVTVSATIGMPNVLASLTGVSNVNASVQGIPNVFVASGSTISIAAMPPVSVAQTVQTVMQGGAPWLVNASVVGQQAVTASVIGVPNVSASIAGIVPVVATYSSIWTVNQGTNPWVVQATIGVPNVVASINGVAAVTATYAAPWSVTATNAGGWVAPQATKDAQAPYPKYISSLVATVVTIYIGGNVNLYNWYLYNPGNSVTHLSLFAQTVATMGLTTPTTVIPVPPGGWSDAPGGLALATYTSGLLVGASASINGTGNPNLPLITNLFWRG